MKRCVVIVAALLIGSCIGAAVAHFVVSRPPPADERQLWDSRASELVDMADRYRETGRREEAEECERESRRLSKDCVGLYGSKPEYIPPNVRSGDNRLRSIYRIRKKD